MPDMYLDVDIALAEVPVNIFPLTDDTDFKTRETAVAYNAAGMDLVWNFVTTNGAFTQTAVTPTTAGVYDWTHQGDGMYTIEIPASGGASINNDTEGYGWFTGVATGVLPWRGPIIGFRAVALNDALIDGGDNLDVNVTQFGGTNATATGGRPEVNASHIAGSAVSTSSAQIGVNVVNAGGTAWGSGAITAASIASNAITSAKIATDAIGAAQLATDAVTEITDATKTAHGVVSGTADSGTTTTMVDAALTQADTDYWKGSTIVFTSGTISGQARLITGFTPASDTVTFAPATTQAVGTNTYIIIPAGRADIEMWQGTTTGAPATAAALVDAVWDEALSGHTTAGTAGKALSDAGSAGDPWSTALPGAYGAGTAGKIIGDNINATISSRLPTANITLSGGAVTVGTNNDKTGYGLATGAITAAVVATGAIDADALATDAVAEIADGVWDEATSGHTTAGTTGKALTDAGSAGDPWSTALPGAYGAGTAGKIIGDNLNATVGSRATQTSVDTVDDFLDTEIAAIKAKTDSLTFTVAGQVDANIQYVNDTAVTGNGSAGTPWGP